MQGIKARLDKLNSFRLEQKGNIPPVDSVAFQMWLLVMPTILGEASWLNADERAAALALNKADAAFKIAEARIWPEFDAKCKELRKELEKDVQKNSLANPDAIDANALELLKSGALTVEDYYSFAERYESNATMLRVISKYALDASENADDTKDAVALRILSDNCKTGMGTVLRAWNELEGVASYCSGRGGSSRSVTTPEHIISMGKWWEELAGQAIENF